MVFASGFQINLFWHFWSMVELGMSVGPSARCLTVENSVFIERVFKIRMYDHKLIV